MNLRAIVFVLCVAMVMPFPQRAKACSCRQPAIGVLFPRAGDEVPRNVRIWVRAVGAEVHLLSPNGDDIPVDVSTINLMRGSDALREITVLTPREPLPPGANYVVSSPSADWGSSQFAVRDEVDVTPPATPEVTTFEPFLREAESTSCGEARGGTIRLDSEGIVFALYDDGNELDEAPPRGTAYDFSAPGLEGIWFSYGSLCSGDWPGGETLSLRFASYDFAGNLSPIGDPEAFRRPVASDEGCSIASPGVRRSHRAWLAFALALGGLAMHRRRTALR